MQKAEYVKTTMINFRVDVRVKEEVQLIVDEMGLSMSGVINAFFKQLIRTREVRFTARNKRTHYFEKIIADSRKNLNTYKLDIMSPEDILDL